MTGRITLYVRQFLHPRMLGIFFLGISTGVPFGVVGDALKNWLWELGLPPEKVALLEIATLPYAVKFLWGLMADDKPLPPFTVLLGRRRGWSFASQIVTAILICVLANVPHKMHFGLTFLIASLVAFAAVFNHVALNAYRIESFSVGMSGISSTMGASGYRVGKLISTALALTLSTNMPWKQVYYCMAGVMVFTAIVMLLNPEPKRHFISKHRPGENFYTLMLAQFKMVIQKFRTRSPNWPWILLFLFTINLGDHLPMGIISYFYRDMGFTPLQVASITKTFALICVVAGGLIGGHLVAQFSLKRVLVGSLILHSLSMLLYYALARTGNNAWLLKLTVALTCITDGAKTAAVAAYVSSLCFNTHFTASQYALLSSMKTFNIPLLGWSSGWLVHLFGWEGFFLIVFLLSWPGLLMLNKLDLEKIKDS